MNQPGPLPSFRTLPEHRRQAIRQQLETAVAEPVHQHSHRLAIISGIAAIVLLGTGAGTVAYIHAQPITNKTEARCYTTASLAGGNNFRGTTIAEAAPPGSKGQVDNALSVCAALWRQGILAPGTGPRANSTNTSANHHVPPLVACTMPDGTAAVFPGDGRTCARLGLPRTAK